MAIDFSAPIVLHRRTSGVWGAVGRALVILPLWALCIGTPIAALSWYAAQVDAAPPVPDILAHEASSGRARIVDSSGIDIGSASAASQPWVSIDEIPPMLVGAFVAAEDANFFEHDGVDPVSLARASWANLRAQGVTQGGSTITQQLAKMYVGRDRTLDRKLREAILARGIERRFTKLEILEAYLNRIYLGAGANGVAAAAQVYFGRRLDELDVAQMALIAGLTSAPSRLDPYRNPEGALERRTYVLRRMAALHLVDEAARARHDAAPLGLATSRPDDTAAPYLVAEARRELRALEAGPLRRWTRDRRGKRIETTAALALQRRAVAEVARGAEQVATNRRDGIRLARLAAGEIGGFLNDAARRPACASGAVCAGVVVAIDETALTVDVALTPARTVTLDAEALRWVRYNWFERKILDGEVRNHRRLRRKVTPGRLGAMLALGDVVQVRVHAVDPAPADPAAGAAVDVAAEVAAAEPKSRVELVPAASIQGALVSVEADSGAVRALAGGTGFDVTEFNRATRGCRQPGSAFKPILYALAMARGFTPATLVHDYPVRYEDGRGRLIWEPRNADRDFDGSITLATALARSRNLPAVKLAETLSVTSVARLARQLGVASRMVATPSLALGASCVKPTEMAAVFGAFARRGRKLDPYLVRSVVADDGDVLWDGGSFSEPAGPIDARLHRVARAMREPPERVLLTEVAYLTTYMLRQVVVGGTGHAASTLGVPVAGKTGTTNEFDVWFVGFTEDVLTAVWLGDDRNRAELGEGESGGTSALPVWRRYTEAAIAQRAQGDPLDDVPFGVEFARIDPSTGERAHPDGPGRWMPFVKGDVPAAQAAAPVERTATRADLLDREF